MGKKSELSIEQRTQLMLRMLNPVARIGHRAWRLWLKRLPDTGEHSHKIRSDVSS